MQQINGWVIFWAVLSPVLAAVGVGLLNYLLNYRAIQVQYRADKEHNREEHERIEAKATALGKAFDKHCELQADHELKLAGTLAEMNTKLNLLVNGKINN